MQDSSLDRRKLLKRGFGAAGVLGLGMLSVSAKAREVCRITANQPEGPFYPIQDQLDKDADLTSVEGRNGRARGEVVILKGIVQGRDCIPIAGALVEIWQACDTGKYNHPSDPNSADLDPNFQYWGRAISNAKGEYQFKTIKPGAYPAGGNWVRPPHIHLKAHLRGFEELTSQVYFADESLLNNKDLILKRLPIADRNAAIVEFNTVDSLKPKVGFFGITLDLIH